ncbi:MAG: glycosyltransferase family 4 protein [Mailhella sp.]|nr:glycosyltransferase family 4 protein [Mailhella sp.]
MRTIQVVNVRWFNATAWYGVALAECLQKAGHETIVAGLSGTPPLDAARKRGLDTVELPFNSNAPAGIARCWHGMKALVRAFRPDVVNCHRGEAFILWAFLKKKHGFALVRTRGDRRLPRNSFVNRWLYRHASDAVIATNSLMARHLSGVMGVPNAKLSTILGGVDTSRFHPDSVQRVHMRQAYGYGDEDVVMGLLGRMDEVKGIRETICALAKARAMDPRAQHLKLLIIGFESQHSVQDVARWSQENGLGPLGDAVKVTGRVESPEAVINALDFGILSSLGSEAIARAALEIMASRVPLISSTTGVMPDLIPATFSFPPGDTGAMAQRMVAMLDTGRREELACVCEAKITRGRLRLNDFLEDTLAVYDRITGQHHV